ncbi:SGNH/GDSL hydrolase family protein [Rothia sp. P5764]|uniref:SGNH/GDSL hydrolase family protein n=1 Tax=Rothia sp. P5764 TaxID=3402654 RepID=UPI003ACE0EAC
MKLENIAITQSGSWSTISVFKPHEGGWVKVSGANSESPLFVPDEGPLLNIATGCGVMGNNNGTANGQGAGAGTRHLLHANVASFSLLFSIRPNPQFGANQPGSMRCSIRRPQSSQWEPLTFSGKSVVSVHGYTDAESTPPAQDVLSDPVSGPFYAGDIIEVMTWMVNTGEQSKGTMGTSITIDPSYDLGISPGAYQEVVAGGDGGFTGRPGKSARPAGFIAPSKQKASWATIGDSNSVNPDRNYFYQALRRRGQAAVIHGKHGESLAKMLHKGWWDFHMGTMLRYADSVYCALGTNDCIFGASAQAVMEDMVIAWAKAGAKRWVQGTVPPMATTSDNWATVAGQAPTVPGLRAMEVNLWLRDGAPVRGGKPAPAGATGSDVSRATVIAYDGAIKRGSGTHPMGLGWVSDTGGAIESTPGSGVYMAGFPASEHGGNDPTHYYQGLHDIQAKHLERDLKLMGF